MKTMHESGKQELLEWMEYIRTHNKMEELETFYEKVSRRITFVFDGIVDYRELKGADTVIDKEFLAYRELNLKRLDLMDEFLLCCDKYLS